MLTSAENQIEPRTLADQRLHCRVCMDAIVCVYYGNELYKSEQIFVIGYIGHYAIISSDISEFQKKMSESIAGRIALSQLASSTSHFDA